jgi:ribosome biogenesis GTPase
VTKKSKNKGKQPATQTGRVVQIVGRRVRVRNEFGERTCFLSGHRVVIGDVVHWVEARGTGGKITGVQDRDTQLRRMDFRGKEQVLAANLDGVFIVDTGAEPPLNPVLLDRFLLGCAMEGLKSLIVLNKIDLGIQPGVTHALALREALGVSVLHTSATTGEGLEDLRTFLAQQGGPWAFIGRSGVGKTSLIAALLPDQAVGPIGEMSEYWGTGRHTTTQSRLFSIPSGGELVDSPGIRMFTPGGLDPEHCARHFIGIGDLPCKYRNCLHREDEDGCAGPEHAEPELLFSYRTLLEELVEIEERRRP